MNRNILILIYVSCLILAFISLAQAEGLSSSASQKIDPLLSKMIEHDKAGEIPVIVILKPDASSSADDLMKDSAVSIKYRYTLIPGLAGDARAGAISELARDDRVSKIYFDGSAQLSLQDMRAPGGSQWNDTALEENSSDQDSALKPPLSADEYLPPARAIRADLLWEKGIDGSGITVAVIDSGIDRNHPDLVGKVVGEKNFLDDETTADDLLGHGTMVAGFIAGNGAASNGMYKGIAPGASLLNAKVTDRKGESKVSDIIAGIEWAVHNGADILSLSLSSINLGETNPPVSMAADKAADSGVVVCVMAGNRNSSMVEAGVRGAFSESAGYLLALPPGLIDSPGDGVNVVTIGAADSSGHIASFSGSGPTRDGRIKPDVVAPGVDLISIVPSGVQRPDPIDAYYARESGTSLSAPIAAGLSALLLQANGNLTPSGVKAAMIRGAKKLNNTNGDIYEEYYQGAGMIDALSSYEAVQNSSNICASTPDLWRAGRWAFLPAGMGVYVGLDTGADRPQKKIYALAPGDLDSNLRFVFFCDKDLEGVRTEALGDLSGWMSIQALPESISANDQKVFSASMAVPEDALPGSYSGSIEIRTDKEVLLEIPISVDVASPLNLSGGGADETGTLNGSEWDYRYLDISSGAKELQASLDWQEDAELDLFLLSPTSEYYSGDDVEEGEESGHKKSIGIENPPSGRWLAVVHSDNVSRETGYLLDVNHFQMETTPMRWNLESVAGSSTEAIFALRNEGQPLDNLSYSAVIESTSQSLEGTAHYKKVWERTINATDDTKKLSASLFSHDQSNSSELMLVFEDPQGEPDDFILGSGDLGPLEISRPQSGPWKVKVYGNDVPETGQPFSLLLKSYAESPWGWVQARGPGRLETNESGALQANLTIPDRTTLSRQDGYIKISSDGHSFEIPVSIMMTGTRLDGLGYENVTDSDGDGLFDILNLGFGVNISGAGADQSLLWLKGTLVDCSGSRIAGLDESISLAGSGIIPVSISGTDIWRKGRCGPMRIVNLMLYDQVGNYIDRFDGKIEIDHDPGQFQPPEGILTGEFVNLTNSGSISVGVNVTVIKPGRYELSGRIVNDYNEDLGELAVQSDLNSGNATMLMQFDPGVFIGKGEASSVHLVDLVLLSDGSEIERMAYAWTSGEMDTQAFSAGSGGVETDTVAKPGGGAGVVRMDSGKAVIS